MVQKKVLGDVNTQKIEVGDTLMHSIQYWEDDDGHGTSEGKLQIEWESLLAAQLWAKPELVNKRDMDSQFPGCSGTRVHSAENGTYRK